MPTNTFLVSFLLNIYIQVIILFFLRRRGETRERECYPTTSRLLSRHRTKQNLHVAFLLQSNKTDLTLDLSLKSSSKRAAMTSFHATTNHPDSDGSCSTTTDSDEIKVFECDKHEEDVNVDDDGTNSDRLSPVIKEEEVSLSSLSLPSPVVSPSSRRHHSKRRPWVSLVSVHLQSPLDSLSLFSDRRSSEQ